LLYTLTLIIGLPASLLIHEIGHLFAARWFGIQIFQISVGFGPELSGYTDKLRTRWSLCLVPLGAKVKMADFDTRCPDGGPSSRSSKNILYAQAVVYSAGPMFSLMLAGVLWLISLAVYGEAVAPWQYSSNIAVTDLSILATFSILVAGFQLLPIMPLDGGWLLHCAVSAFTRRSRVPLRTPRFLILFFVCIEAASIVGGLYLVVVGLN
jgi:membrane-associated protease RseP (regulator of RpoE activity)